MIYQFCFRSKWLAIAFVAGLLGFASIHDHRASRLLTLMLNCNYRYDRILGSSIFNDLIHIGNIPIELGRLRNAKSRGSAAAVSVHVFVESLCVDSKLFFDQQLTPAFEILGPTVMNIAVVSFGNARISSEELTCQHGKAECDANSYEQCATDVYKEVPGRYIPYLACLFDRLPMGHSDVPFSSQIFASCATATALSWTAIQDCHEDPERSWALQQQAAAKTAPTNYTYVPWVVLNGNHVDDETFSNSSSLLILVCHAYTAAGGSHPACN